MKKFVTILILITAIISCKKTETVESIKGTIIGKWELRSSLCGRIGPMNYPVGNGNTITFNSNGQYTATGTRMNNGIYRLSTRTDSQGQIENLLYLGGNWNQEFRFSITGDALKLDENAFIYDGCEYNYQKL